MATDRGQRIFLGHSQPRTADHGTPRTGEGLALDRRARTRSGPPCRSRPGRGPSPASRNPGHLGSAPLSPCSPAPASLEPASLEPGSAVPRCPAPGSPVRSPEPYGSGRATAQGRPRTTGTGWTSRHCPYRSSHYFRSATRRSEFDALPKRYGGCAFEAFTCHFRPRMTSSDTTPATWAILDIPEPVRVQVEWLKPEQQDMGVCDA